MLLPQVFRGGLSASLGASLLLVSPLLAVAQSSDDFGWVPFDLDQFNGNTTLDADGDVQLFWKTGDEYSTYGIASRSKGYLALGFSETRAMTGADMAVGYSDDNGNFVLENRFASGFITPQVSDDQKNNIRLKEGSQADGVTAFVFEKKNKADCVETQANVATNAWQWIIYAFSDENTFGQHASDDKGRKYVKLGTGKTIAVNEVREIKGDHVKNFTLAQGEVTIPTDESTFCYTLHKLPEGKRNFLLGERPHEMSELVHHLTIYTCYGIDDEIKKTAGDEPNCTWQNFSNPCNGFLTEWAPSMVGRTFEDGYGKPFGEDLYEYVMLETHYNNPQGLKGETDNGSFTFLYTEEQVEHEIGTLTLGDLQVAAWTLEPGHELISHSSVCTAECTENWPKEGITVFSVFHHMHFRGKRARVQIIRDGKEIEPMSELYNFEYGHQFAKNLDSVKLMPGDQFITTCEYDTSDDTETVHGGLTSPEEMCFAWVDYYPANSVLVCTNWDLDQEEEGIEGLSGKVGFCLDAAATAPPHYEADLEFSFDKLAESGNMCSASNSTEEEASSGNDNASGNGNGTETSSEDDNAESAASVASIVLTLLVSMLALAFCL